MKKRKSPDELNPNEKLFCAAYVELGQNGTRAYQRVWPKANDSTAGNGAWRLLRNPQIVKEIKRLNDERLSVEIMSATEVLAELGRIGQYDIGDITGPDGRLLPLREMPERVRRAIKAIKRDAKGNVEVTFHDKNVALGLMAKHHRLVSDTLNVNGKLTLEDLVNASWENNDK